MSLGQIARTVADIARRPQDWIQSDSDPLRYWRKHYGSRWGAKQSSEIVAAEGALAGSQGLYLAHPLLVEEYTILDALIRHYLAERGEVRIADIACGGGLACFFAAANRERYARRISYVGVDSSEAQLTVARIRNPWSFAEFHEGNLYATGLPAKQFDVVLNWQCINHIGRFPDALRELVRISRGSVYLVNLIYYEHEEFRRRFGDARAEASWGDLAWAFDRDAVREFANSLEVRQLWRPIQADRFPSGSVPPGSTAEHTIFVTKESTLESWAELDLSDAWQESIRAL